MNNSISNTTETRAGIAPTIGLGLGLAMIAAPTWNTQAPPHLNFERTSPQLIAATSTQTFGPQKAPKQDSTQEQLQKLLLEFQNFQEPLGSEFTSVWTTHRNRLYEV